MAAIRRLYIVKGKDKSENLVRACTQAQAIGHVVRANFTAEVAGQDDIVRLVSSGQKVQDAGDA